MVDNKELFSNCFDNYNYMGYGCDCINNYKKSNNSNNLSMDRQINRYNGSGAVVDTYDDNNDVVCGSGGGGGVKNKMGPKSRKNMARSILSRKKFNDMMSQKPKKSVTFSNTKLQTYTRKNKNKNKKITNRLL